MAPTPRIQAARRYRPSGPAGPTSIVGNQTSPYLAGGAPDSPYVPLGAGGPNQGAPPDSPDLGPGAGGPNPSGGPPGGGGSFGSGVFNNGDVPSPPNQGGPPNPSGNMALAGRGRMGQRPFARYRPGPPPGSGGPNPNGGPPQSPDGQSPSFQYPDAPPNPGNPSGGQDFGGNPNQGPPDMGGPNPSQGPPGYTPGMGPLGGGPDTSWFNPYGASSNNPMSGMPSPSTPYYSGSDIAQQWQNNRNMDQNQGDMFQQYFGNQASQRFGLESSALGKSNQLYDQLERNPGYTPDEQDRMLGNRPDGGNDFQDLLNTDYGSNYLTQDEQDQIRGNPYDPMNQLHPEQLTGDNNTAYKQSQGYIQGTQDDLNNSYDYLKKGLYDSVGNDLNLSNPFQRGMQNVEQTTDDRVWGAAKNPGLDMSGEYGRQAGMTDQEVSDTAAMGGQAVGARSRAAIQDLDRQAAASGNSSPLAVAAMRSQFEDQNAVNSADATVNAQLSARQQQRNAATGVENTRLGAEQYKTGAQIDAGSRMGQFVAGNEKDVENMRLSSARDVSNRKLGIASQLGTVGRENALWTGQQNLQNESDWANRGQQANMFNQGMGYNASRNAEQQGSDRASQLAGNRQGVNFQNQGNKFNRGYQVGARLSDTYNNIAQNRMQGQRELRGYYTGQQQYQGAQGNELNRDLLTNRQQTQQGRNQATQGASGWELGNKNAPNWYTKNVLPATKAAAGMFGGG